MFINNGNNSNSNNNINNIGSSVSNIANNVNNNNSSHNINNNINSSNNINNNINANYLSSIDDKQFVSPIQPNFNAPINSSKTCFTNVNKVPTSSGNIDTQGGNSNYIANLKTNYTSNISINNNKNNAIAKNEEVDQLTLQFNCDDSNFINNKNESNTNIKSMNFNDSLTKSNNLNKINK